VDVAVDYIPRNRYRYNTKLRNWEKFHKFWEYRLNIFSSLEFLNSIVCDRYAAVIGLIDEAIEFSCPTRKTSSICYQDTRVLKNKRKFPAVWWNEACEKAVRFKKAKWLSLQFH